MMSRFPRIYSDSTVSRQHHRRQGSYLRKYSLPKTSKPTPAITATPATNHAGQTTAPEADATPTAGIAKPTILPKDPEAPPIKTGDPQSCQGSLSDLSSNKQLPPASLNNSTGPSSTNKDDPLVGKQSPSPADPEASGNESGNPR